MKDWILQVLHLSTVIVCLLYHRYLRFLPMEHHTSAIWY